MEMYSREKRYHEDLTQEIKDIRNQKRAAEKKVPTPFLAAVFTLRFLF